MNIVIAHGNALNSNIVKPPFGCRLFACINGEWIQTADTGYLAEGTSWRVEIDADTLVKRARRVLESQGVERVCMNPLKRVQPVHQPDNLDEVVGGMVMNLVDESLYWA